MTYVNDFEKIISEQKNRVERMKGEGAPTDFTKKEHIVIGVIADDGIGPIIAKEARRVLERVLAKEIADAKIELRDIDGLTIENRLAVGKAIPDDVLAIIISIHMISMINGIEVFRVPDGSAESALFRTCMRIGYFMSFVFSYTRARTIPVIIAYTD